MYFICSVDNDVLSFFLIVRGMLAEFGVGIEVFVIPYVA